MIAGLVLAAALIGAGVARAATGSDAPAPAPTRNAGQLPDARPGITPPGSTGRSTAGSVAGPRPADRASAGVAIRAGARLAIPGLGVSAPIVPVQVAGDVMQVPTDPRTVGWWRGGAAPGSTTGSVVIVGHVNYAGVSGALGRIGLLVLGARIEIRPPGGLEVRDYRLVAVRSYPKTHGIPGDAFRRTGAPQLVLITCGGAFDAATGNYLDNVVAYAVPD